MFALSYTSDMVIGYGGRERKVLWPTPFGVILGLFILICLYSSWFTVGKGEQAVTLRLGTYSGSHTSGGPYLKLPWPFEIVEKVDVQHINEIPIGYRIEDGKAVDVVTESEVLTGDMNTVMIDSTLQYQRTDAKQWLFSSSDPTKMLALLAQGALRSAVAERGFDQILTTDRPAAQTAAEGRIRDIANKMGIGANIVAHQIQDTKPPGPVVAAFQDVTNAYENNRKSIQEAIGYRKERLATALGQTKKLLEDASGYKNRRINEAMGAADRFNLVYAEYKNAPDLTKDRMRFEALEAILPGKAQLIDKTGASGHSSVLKLMDVGAAAQAKVTPPVIAPKR